MDVATFLRSHAPFDELDAAGIDAVVAATDVVFLLKGESLWDPGGDPLAHVYVVRSGSVDLLDGGEVVDQAGEGELVGAVSMLAVEPPVLAARAHEETLLYRVRRDAATALFATPSGAGFLGRSLGRRERRLLTHVDAATADPWVVPLAEVATPDVLQVDADASIRDAAVAMAAARVSSALVRDGATWAIVTDRDLRARVLAEDLDPSTPVGAVASSPIASLPMDATAAEALGLMLELGVHHVPVTDAGDVRAIVTDTDLLALERRSVLRLRHDLAVAPTVEDAVAAGTRIPEALADLVTASMDPLAVGHLAGVLRDTLTARLVELETARLGPSPCPFAWITLGSQARYEQGIETDQDHAIVTAPERPGEGEAFAADLGEAVTAAIEATGIPRCRAGVVAANEAWRGTLEDWTARFASWARDPDPWAFGRAAIALDHRVLVGPEDVAHAFVGPVRALGANPMVQRRLARWVIDQRPPRGFLRSAIIDGRGASDVVFDVKRQGIAIVTALARVGALRAGVTDNRTGARLRAAARTGLLEPADAAGLEEVFGVLWQVRLDHQAAQVRAGLLPDDQVDPRTLGPLARQALKEAFRRIESAQQVLGLELGIR